MITLNPFRKQAYRIVISILLPFLSSWTFSGAVRAESLLGSDLSYSAAANELAQKLVASFPKITGYVLSAAGEMIYIDLGEKEKVYPGMELNLYREGETFSHPITGEVLGRFEEPLGRLRILEVREKFSTAVQIAKVVGVAVTKGDRVRMTGARIPLALPAIEVAGAKGDEAKTITRELALALARTERFEVWDERRLLSGLQAEGVSEPVIFTDPKVLELLEKKLRVPLLALGKASGLFLDLQILSTATRSPLTIASVETQPLPVRPPTEVARPISPESGIFKPTPPPQAIGSPITSPTFSPAVEGVWKGPRIDKALNALVVADVNGDRQPELVVAAKQQIMIYAIDSAGYRILYTMPKETILNIISLDAADINGNGICEIFATSCVQGRLNSFVLEYREGKFIKIWENVNLFLRCLPTDPKGGYQLFGQYLGRPDQPWGRVNQYIWSGNGYKEGPVLNLPSKASLYGLAWMDIDGDAKRDVIFLSQSNRLEIYGEDGKRKYKSSEKYGGTALVVEVTPVSLPPSNPTSPMHLPESQESESYYLQARLFPLPGMAQFYVCKNSESALSIAKGVRFFDKSKILRLAWDGDSLQTAWESKDFPQYMADYYMGDFDGDGAQEVAILLVEKNLIGADNSVIWIYKI